MKLDAKALAGKKIGVLMGGLSDEREISLKTGAAILNTLKESGFRAVGIDAGRDLPAKLVKEKIGIAFLALHGRYGEDGCVQGLLEVMGIPYTGSGVQASSIAMDKLASKKFFKFHGVRTPAFVNADDEKAVKKLKMPVVVKPATQGSAIGVTIVREKAKLNGAIRKARSFGGPVIIEEFIEGRELTVAILNKKALPIIEIRPKRAFYDYKAKYTKGVTDFIVPARIPAGIEKKVSKAALAAYFALGCSGGARVDVMLRNSTPFVLEVNTIPGMTELSLFPRAAAAVGLDYKKVVKEMLLEAGTGKV